MSDINDIIAPEALKGLDQLNLSLAKAVELLDKITQQSATLDATMSKLSATVKDNRTAQEGVNTAAREATNINSNLKRTEDDIVAAKIKFARANKQQRDEIGALITLEDKQAGTLEKIVAQNKLLREEQRKLNLETKEGIKRNKEINKEIDANTAFVKKNSDSLVKQKMNIGNYQSAISGLPGPLGMAATAIQSFTRVLLMNPLAAVIMAIVGAIALLVKAFKGTEEGGDRLKRVFDQIKAAIDAVFDRIKNLATGLFKVFSGEAKLKDLKGTFKGLGDEIKRETELAGQLADMMDRLEDREIDMIVISADRKASIDKLMEASSDQTKTELERYNALTKAKKLIDEETAAQQSLLLTRIANELGMTNEETALKRINEVRKEGKQITLEEIGLSISTNVDRKRVNELLAQYIGLEEQAATESRRMVSRMSGLRDEAQKQVKFQKLANEAQRETIITTEAATTATEKYFESVNKLQSTELLFNERLAESNANLQDAKIAQLTEEMEMQKQLKDLKIEVLNSAFDLGATIVDRQSAKVEAAYQKEVAAAGDNAEKKAAIDEKYDKKRKAIMRKQALVDKAQSLFNIGINTATGVASALAKTVTIPLIPWIIAMGAIQAAAVLATPLPQYAKGTKYSKAGPAVVGERGRELMISPSGQVALTGDSAHLTMLQAGTKIIPSDETRAILQAASVSKRSTIENTIKAGNEDIVKAVKGIRLEINAKTGRSIETREGDTYRTYFNRHIN